MRNPAVSATAHLSHAWRDARLARLRTPPRVRFGSSNGAPPRIFYLSPDAPSASGGVRVIYRHVDLLNQLGFDAAVLHKRSSYRAHWFQNRTRLAAARDVVLTDQDVLVVPEIYGGKLSSLAGGPRIVVLNQGAYYTFAGIPLEEAAKLRDFPIEAILTVSEDSLRLLGAVFENTPIHHVRSVIDGLVFHPPAAGEGRRRLAYVTSRRSIERGHVLGALAIRGRLKGWETVAIEALSEQEVAAALRSSAIFLSFSQLDGFGLPPVEAMACGCYVVGFHGQGGQEYFDPAYSHPVPDADVLAFVRAVEDAAVAYDCDPVPLTRAGLEASKTVLERYNEAGLRDDLSAFCQSLGLEPGASAEVPTNPGASPRPERSGRGDRDGPTARAEFCYRSEPGA